MEAFGKEPPEPEEPPECGLRIWGFWWQLNGRRAAGFDQLCPISYTEIYHWLQLTGHHLARHEIAWLVQMDDAWMHAISEQRKAKIEREKEAST